LEADELRKRYFDMYPEERITHPFMVLRDQEAHAEWYTHPVEAFVKRYFEIYPKLPKKEAWDQCVLEKKLEEETFQIEREVCRMQAEELFGIERTDPMRFAAYGASTDTELYSMRDPRVVEYDEREKRDFLDNKIKERIENPSIPKLTIGTTNMSNQELLDYLHKNPQQVEHFDESVYFADFKTEFIPDTLIDPAEASAYNDDEDPKEVDLLDGLDNTLKTYVDGFIEHYSDKIDPTQINDPEQKKTLFKIR